MKPKAIQDLRGHVFGRLLVLAQHEERSSAGKVQWICHCECGNEIVAIGNNLKQGATKSCGCLNRDKASARARERSTKHGQCKRENFSPTYRSWASMHRRCRYPTVNSFDRYGGRGITVCERWSDFSAFLADMGERPTGTTLDRINPDGNYEPSNCRWATAIEQRRNRSKPDRDKGLI